MLLSATRRAARMSNDDLLPPSLPSFLFSPSFFLPPSSACLLSSLPSSNHPPPALIPLYSIGSRTRPRLDRLLALIDSLFVSSRSVLPFIITYPYFLTSVLILNRAKKKFLITYRTCPGEINHFLLTRLLLLNLIYRAFNANSINFITPIISKSFQIFYFQHSILDEKNT